VDWEQIRRHYAARLADARRRGFTQKAVATAGKLSGQNAISKLLANENLGPSVETFVKAVTGLGLTVSEFFAEIERGESVNPRDQLHAALVTTRSEVLSQRIVLGELVERLDRLERSIAGSE
jgi:transcriptional regulator with XRE-family HTH domain